VLRDLHEVEAEMQARDTQDASRSTAPMKPAEDAVLLDTTALDIEHAFATALAIVRARLGG
jgi:cytidylate kinase